MGYHWTRTVSIDGPPEKSVLLGTSMCIITDDEYIVSVIVFCDVLESYVLQKPADS